MRRRTPLSRQPRRVPAIQERRRGRDPATCPRGPGRSSGTMIHERRKWDVDRHAMVFALLHSPLVGPFTWSLVAEHLRQRGVETAVPALDDVEGSPVPYWQQHAGAVARGLR